MSLSAKAKIHSVPLLVFKNETHFRKQGNKQPHPCASKQPALNSLSKHDTRALGIWKERPGITGKPVTDGDKLGSNVPGSRGPIIILS